MKKIFVLLAAAAIWAGCDQSGYQGGTGSEGESRGSSGSMQRDTTTPAPDTGSQTNQTNSINQGGTGTQSPQQQPQATPEQ